MSRDLASHTAAATSARYAYEQLTPSQRQIANQVFAAATRVRTGRLLLIRGPAASGKTHLLITLHRELRARGFNVLCTSFTAATAAELANDGAATTHRTFGITFRNEPSMRFLGSPAEFALASADILIWDHAEYSHRAHLEIADQRVRHLSGRCDEPFGDHLVVVLVVDTANLNAVGWERDFNAHLFCARSPPNGRQLLANFSCFNLPQPLCVSF